MRRKLLKRLLLGFVIMFTISENAYADSYPTILGIGGDKYLHFGVSAALTGGFYLTMTALTGRDVEGRLPILIGSSVMAFSFGLAKEVMDMGDAPKGSNRQLDGGDLAANVAGIVTTATAIYFLDIHGKKSKNVNITFTGRVLVVGIKF